MSPTGRRKGESRHAQQEGPSLMAASLQADVVLAALERWVAAGWLRELDRTFAAFLAQEVPDAPALLLLGAALASHQLGRGHVCLELASLVTHPAEVLAIPPEEGAEGAPDAPQPMTPAALLAGIELADWQSALAEPRVVAPGEGDTPLVLSGTRLYLRRYWQHEQVVRAGIAARLDAKEQWSAAKLARLREALELLFPKGPLPVDWQKVACALALRSEFGIVTGGPGTGKTTTVVKLLALLQHLSLTETGGSGRRLRIRLAAPTGKAAARLNTSIANALQDEALARLPDAGRVRDAIPTDVSTVHRLLGSFGGSRRFRYGAGNPLPLDVLVLDEASMVDLETMAAVLLALPPNARLVLLGDKDQLASVEAGNVLGELCQRADDGHYLPATRSWLAAATGEQVADGYVDSRGEALDQAVVKLRHSYRFGVDSGIGQLADAVNAGDVQRVHGILRTPRADLSRIELDARDAALRRLVLDGAADGFGGGEGEARGRPAGYRNYLRLVAASPPAEAGAEELAAWAQGVLKAHGDFQLLCAVRRGPYGVEGLNERIARLLHAERLTPAAGGWYAGRPVMVTRNDYTLGLMNGDVGVTLALPLREEPGRVVLRVAFQGSDGGIRWILPSRLREVETVFAMTVHKSQGSEFGHAALLLPQESSRVLTRELVYTGITRARKWFTLAIPSGAAEVLDVALGRRARQVHDAPLLTGPRGPGGKHS
jgi:exodeoxyribonuclease V alpha subunit